MSEARPWYLYVIGGRAEGPVKVGISRSVEDRVLALQPGYPERLEIFGRYECDRRLEGTVHQILKEYRQAGEWFGVSAARAQEAISLAFEMVKSGAVSVWADRLRAPDGECGYCDEYHRRAVAAVRRHRARVRERK